MNGKKTQLSHFVGKFTNVSPVQNLLLITVH